MDDKLKAKILKKYLGDGYYESAIDDYLVLTDEEAYKEEK